MKKFISIGIILIFSVTGSALAKSGFEKPVKNLTKQILKSLSADGTKHNPVLLVTLEETSVYKPSSLSRHMTMALKSGLVKKGITVLDRESIKFLIEEHKLAYSGILDESTVVALGKSLGAKYIIRGFVDQSYHYISANMNIVDLRSGVIKGDSYLTWEVTRKMRKLIASFPDRAPSPKAKRTLITTRKRGQDGNWYEEHSVRYEGTNRY